VPDLVTVIQTVEVRGDVVLKRADSTGHSPDGGVVSWQLHVVEKHRAGRIVRWENFDVEDTAAARARFEELAAEDPRTPCVDNDAV
jgi:ketosteroid isomerase-like protein